MYRGVSKKVIEINATENDIFEKAILIMRQNVDFSEKEIKNNADKYINTIQNNIKQKSKNNDYLLENSKEVNFKSFKKTPTKKEKRKRFFFPFFLYSIITVIVGFIANLFFKVI